VVTPGLQDNTHAGAPALVAVRGVGAEHLDPPARPHPEPFQDLDRGGLAGPVRPEQDQHFPMAGLEGHIVQDVGRAVAHAQTPGHPARPARRSMILFTPRW
jgi:hypothetical protein